MIDFCIQKGSESLIHPGILEFVGADKAVEIAMPELMDGHSFRAGDAFPCDKVRSAGEQRRILHPSGAAVVGRVDTCGCCVGIITVEEAAVFYGVFHGIHVAVLEPFMLRLKKESNLCGFSGRKLETFYGFEESRAGCPGKIMHTVLVKVMGCGPIIIIGLFPALSGGANNKRGGESDSDIVCSVIGKIFARRMVLMAVPLSVCENADFRKPLSDEIIILVYSCSGDGTGDFGFKLDPELDCLAGPDGARKYD
ncbi:hypothetical protein ES703_115461 [subsurface metagenome]